MQSYHRSVHLVEVGGRLWGGKGCVGQVDRRLVGKGCVGQVDRRLARTLCMCEVAGSARRPVAPKTSVHLLFLLCYWRRLPRGYPEGPADRGSCLA